MLMAPQLRRGLAVAGLAAAGALVPAAVFAWGEAGHRIIGEAAALALPPSAPAFLRDAHRRLAYLNPEPDRWHDRAESTIDPALDGATSPDHFIDMDLVPPAVLASALRARDRYAYADTLASAGARAQVMGFLPFRMLEMSERLRIDFRNWRAAPDSVKPFIEQRIIDDAGVLGHYVADGSNPLHTTVRYNGWTGANPKGYATDKRTHSRFESAYVSANITLADVTPRVDTVARVLPNLRTAIDDYLRESNALVERLYQLDKSHPFDANTTSPEDKAFVADRLAAAARMLRDIWWTAWVTSAQ